MMWGLFLTLFLLTFCGCSSSSKIEADETAVNVFVPIEEFSMADSFFIDYKFVLLEDKENVLIGHDTKYRTSTDYILSYSQDNGFHLFDMSGMHISSIANYGLGPNEYLDISDFYIQGESCYAVDRIKNKVLKYRLPGLTVESYISLPGNYLYIAPLSTSIIAMSPAYCNNDMWNFTIYNMAETRITNEFMEYDYARSVIFDDFNAFVGKGGSCVYSVLPFDNILYKLTEGDCAPIYKYNFGTSEQLPVGIPQKADISALAEEYRYKHVVKWLGPYTKSTSGKNYQSFLLLCDYGILPYVCQFNDGGSSVKTIRIGADRFSKFPFLTFKPIEFNGDNYVCVADADILLDAEVVVGEFPFSSQGLTADSNPVIFFYRMR